MLTKKECRKLVAEKLGIENITNTEEDKYCILDNATIDFGFGWVFFYTSKKFIDTGDRKYILLGNRPFLVDKMNGNIKVIWRALDTEGCLDEYLVENYRGEVRWSVDESYLPTTDTEKIKWLNSIKVAFNCDSVEASDLLSRIHEIMFPNRKNLNRLEKELMRRRVKLKIRRFKNGDK